MRSPTCTRPRSLTTTPSASPNRAKPAVPDRRGLCVRRSRTRPNAGSGWATPRSTRAAYLDRLAAYLAGDPLPNGGARGVGAVVVPVAVDALTDYARRALEDADATVSAAEPTWQRVGGLPCHRPTDGPAVSGRHLARQGGRRVHEVRHEERRQGGDVDVVGGHRRSTPHALGVPGPGGALEQLGRLPRRPQSARLLPGRRRAERCSTPHPTRSTLRREDMPASGRAGSRARSRNNWSTAPNHVSGLRSCSIVGTSSLTVGWMCMVREMAV